MGDTATIYPDLPYKKHNMSCQKLDLYLPANNIKALILWVVNQRISDISMEAHG
jgi:hypothetical protein